MNGIVVKKRPVEGELLVNVAPYETRIARVENGRAEEVYIERAHARGVRGNIYKGRVVRIVPGIQAAFVEIGLPRAGFLYAGDVRRPAALREEDEPASMPGIPSIGTLMNEGDEILVQVLRDPIGAKGPRLTTQIGLPGRFLVLLPEADFVGVAKRIESPEERTRLAEIAARIKPKGAGLIVRTVAEGCSEEELMQDLAFLKRLWEDIQSRAQHAPAGSLLYQDLDLPLQVMRDYVDRRVVKIHVDSRETYERMRGFAERFMPEVLDRIFYYPGERPIFDLYGVEQEIEQALKKRIPLRSGGYIVIEQTEALVAIDVNSGGHISSRNLEETGFKTNLEAAREIAHQLRLRNLGGIIVIDFIDMREEAHRQRLLAAFEEALARDPAKTVIVQFSALGLLLMTRKRTRDSLNRTLLASCACCSGLGRVKSATTICYQLFRELVAEARAYPCERLTVVVHPQIATRLRSEEATHLAKLEAFLKRRITIVEDDRFRPDQYEVRLS